MTFTSIPPSLRPVVGDLVDVMIRHGREGNVDPEPVILAFLNACVERQIGRVSDVKARNSERIVATRLILNLGATDDTA